MSLNVKTLSLNGPEIFCPTRRSDERGNFSEIWKPDWFPAFKQMNLLTNELCTFRGLRYQWDRPQGKLIRVNHGRAMFFELDIRTYSPTFGQYETIELSHDTGEWLWVPPGFADGFFTLENDTQVLYMCTEEWSENEGRICHDSLSFPFEYFGGIRHISDKDQNAPTISESVSHLESISGFFGNNNERVV